MFLSIGCLNVNNHEILLITPSLWIPIALLVTIFIVVLLVVILLMIFGFSPDSIKDNIDKYRK